MRALTAWAPTTSSTLATPSLPARAGHDPQRARHRAPHVSGGNGARRRAPMSLEEELRRRADRLAELDRRERQRPTPPSSEQRFWRDVSVLLGTDQAARADAREADLIDQVQALDTVNRRSAVEQLSHWLDE